MQMKENKGVGFDIPVSPWKLSKSGITTNLMQHVCDMII
jgi:hypothetical protein